MLGTGFTAGGGLEVVVNSQASLDVRLLRTWGQYDEIKTNGSGDRDFSAMRESTTRLQLGVNWRPPIAPG